MKKVILTEKYARCIIQKMVLSLVLTLYASLMQAQVNIGVNELPVTGALLQLKEIVNVTDSTQNANRGLALPRVQLSDVNQLYPMFLNDPANPNSGPNAAYAGNGKVALDNTHTGLIVYNVTDDASKGLSPGLAQWDGRKWIPLSQSGTGSAIFATIDCQDITVNGAYAINTPTGSQNYLSVNLDVTTPGAYTIIAHSNNGYSFYLSGMALNIGRMTVTVPAQGTPIAVSNPAIKVDTLVISGIPVQAGCKKTITVTEQIAKYSLNCSAVVFWGKYQKEVQLDGDNFLTMDVSVYEAGSYYISTPVTNGISFSASGVWNAAQIGPQTVTLIGSGTPTTHINIPITINANTQQGTATCSVIVPVTAPPMTYAVISNGSNWGWKVTRTRALMSQTNFGLQGTVKIEGFSNLWIDPVNDMDEACGYLTNGYSGKFPDIVLYNCQTTSTSLLPDLSLAKALASYVKKGGCLIFGVSSDDTSAPLPTSTVDTLLVNMFGPFGSGPSPTSVVVPQIEGTLRENNCYLINNIPNDPIINGPFGNLGGYYWGEENYSTYSKILPVLPPLSVQICSAFNLDGKGSVSPISSIVWYSTSLNFVYFGDSVGATDNPTASATTYPALYPSGSFVPTSKLYGTSTTSHYVFNAQLEMNAVAWAIKRALTNGINPH